MKYIGIAALSALALRAGLCPVEPPDLKPSPPAGYSDVTHACSCDSLGSNCQWVWVGVNKSGASSNNSSVLDVLAHGGISGIVAENQRTEAETAKTKEQTELIKEQTRTLEMENIARRHQLEQQGLIPHVETKDEKAQREFEDRLRAARSKYRDFNDAVGRDDFKPTPAMQKEIFKSRAGVELSYWLATHPVDFRNISTLPRNAEIKALRKIESTLRP